MMMMYIVQYITVPLFSKLVDNILNQRQKMITILKAAEYLLLSGRKLFSERGHLFSPPNGSWCGEK